MAISAAADWVSVPGRSANVAIVVCLLPGGRRTTRRCMPRTPVRPTSARLPRCPARHPDVIRWRAFAAAERSGGVTARPYLPHPPRRRGKKSLCGHFLIPAPACSKQNAVTCGYSVPKVSRVSQVVGRMVARSESWLFPRVFVVMSRRALGGLMMRSCWPLRRLFVGMVLVSRAGDRQGGWVAAYHGSSCDSAVSGGAEGFVCGCGFGRGVECAGQ